MAIAGRKSTIVKEGDSIISVNTAPKKNLEGITDFNPTIVQRPERTSVVDSTYLDHSRLVQHMAGAATRCSYYNSVVGADDTLRPQDLNADPVNQQYHCYRDMIIRITSPINVSSQDIQSREFDVRGSGDMYYVLPPNMYDMFVMDVGGASTGIFTITQIEKLSYLKFSAYHIEFKLVAIDDMQRLEDLERKIVRTMYYDESLLDYFNTPFLDEDTKKKYEDLGERYAYLHNYYVDSYWNRAYQSYRIPTDISQLAFDPLHANYMRWIGLEEQLRPATTWDIGSTDLTRVRSIWWLLKDKDISSLPLVTNDVKSIYTRYFKVHYGFRNIAYSGYDITMYPYEDKPFQDKDEARASPVPLVYPKQTQNELWPMIENGTYVFSKAFYSADLASMTTLERITYKMLKGDPIPVDDLIKVSAAITNAEHIRQFYFIPIILTLLAMARRKPIWL